MLGNNVYILNTNYNKYREVMKGIKGIRERVKESCLKCFWNYTVSIY